VSGTRVLVVDDEAPIRGLIAKIVERSGHSVTVARDGGEAIARLGEEEFGVVVLDLMMPSVDGYAVIDFIRSRGGVRPAIIVITAGDSAAIRQLDGAMVHSVVRKPFDIDVLGDLIGAAAEAMAEAQKSGEHNVITFPRQNEVC
jgi:two-component system response regulator VanR